jgi:hypothetical protein
VGLGGVDIHVRNDEAFRSSIGYGGELEVPRWLLSVDSCVSSSSPFVHVDVHDARLRSWSRARDAWCSWVKA